MSVASLSAGLHNFPYLNCTSTRTTVKLPFPLTLGFKSMLQRGVETPDMDVRWVSSISWYFLNFFGLNGLYRMILGDNCKPFPPCLSHDSCSCMCPQLRSRKPCRRPLQERPRRRSKRRIITSSSSLRRIAWLSQRGTMPGLRKTSKTRSSKSTADNICT